MSDGERREYLRFASKGSFLIYGSQSIKAYSVDLKNISRSGAFIQTNHLLKFGERVDFDILNVDGARIASGQGRVARLMDDNGKKGKGFGVQFNTKLPKQIENSFLPV